MTSKTKNIKEKDKYLRRSWNLYKNVLEEHLGETIDKFTDSELVQMLELIYKISLENGFRNCHFKMKSYLVRKRDFSQMTRAEKVSIIMPCLKKMTFVNSWVPYYIIFAVMDLANNWPRPSSEQSSYTSFIWHCLMIGILSYFIRINQQHQAKIYQKIIDLFMKVYKRNNSEKNVEELSNALKSLKIELEKKDKVQQILMKEVNNRKTKKKVNKRKAKQNKKQIHK